MSGYESIIVALIVSVLAPTIVAWQTNRSRRAEKREDWARLDQVRDQAAEAARLLVQSNNVTNSKLDVIHTLVNSNMTAAMQDALDSTIRERAALMELAELRRATGSDPKAETTAAIALASSIIADLQATLADRRKSA